MNLQVKVTIDESCCDEIIGWVKINVKCEFPQIDFHSCSEEEINQANWEEEQ